jgi:predicted extracellular nuclease
MKKILLLSFCLVSAFISNAQCTGIFISEVVEGWSNNKAVEIYNPTANTVNLNGIGLVRFSNGSTSYGSIALLDGYSIAAHDVIVVVLDKQDQLGTGLEAPVWDDLAAAADVFMNPTYDNGVWPMYFNGNDAIAIVSNNGQTLLDLYGRIGEGTGFGGWSSYGTDPTSGATLYASTDHTQIRKSTVTSGITLNPSTFDVFAQYDTLPANTFTFLGAHTCDCNVGVNENVEHAISIYPNPVTGDILNVVSPSIIRSIRIYDNTGRVVFANGTILDRMTRVQTANLSKGAYTVEVISENGTINRQNFIK